MKMKKCKKNAIIKKKENNKLVGKPINRKARKDIDPNSKVQGGCAKSNEYNHNMLGCEECGVARALSTQCQLVWCICNGAGRLFPTVGVKKNKLFLHQLVNDNKSVRICSTRQKQAVERIQKRVASLEFDHLLSHLDQNGVLEFSDTADPAQYPCTPLGDDEEYSFTIINEYAENQQ